MLASGHLLEPFTQRSVYPILGALVGALAAFVGGVNVASPIIGENLVFVPLLALGCYQTGKLLFGRLAGALAVLFVCGSPLLISLFHVFMLDGPVTALVAVSTWLILASEDFGRPRVAAVAGLAVGLGFNMKSQFPLFVIGLVVIALIHGGWRNWRGFSIFCVVAAIVGLPWYAVHLGDLGKLLEIGGTASGAPGNGAPTLSADNLLWYFWSMLNSQLLAPLFMLVAGGTLWMLVVLVRGRGRPAAQLELLAGAFAAWLAITLTPHHDIRYGVPLLAYTAVIGTGWITRLPRRVCIAAIALLVLGVACNTLGTDFGVGREVSIVLASEPAGSEQSPDRVVLYSTSGFLVSAPSRDGDVPGMLDALGRDGVRTLALSLEQSELPDFSIDGLFPLARIAKLAPTFTRSPEYSRSVSVATLIHEPVSAGVPPTCTRLSDGTGVWVIRYDVAARAFAYYCPMRHPRYYGLGAVD